MRGAAFISASISEGRAGDVKAWAKEFYLSKAWRRVRAYIVQRDHGLCVKCGRPGEIVHHKEHLTREKILNPAIALGEDNLELLCRDCHGIEHATDLPTDAGLVFDEEGNLVEREFMS